jgi:hypothetical protein
MFTRALYIVLSMNEGINIKESIYVILTSILLFTLKNPSASAWTVGFDAPTAMIAP